MPLNPKKTKAAFKQNIKAEIGDGKPPKQAVAIAYSEMQRRPKRQLPIRKLP